jgi:hypothetical protein
MRFDFPVTDATTAGLRVFLLVSQWFMPTITVVVGLTVLWFTIKWLLRSATKRRR